MIHSACESEFWERTSSYSGGAPIHGKIDSHHAAAPMRRRSSPGAATSCSPSGRRWGPSPLGITIAGAPISDHLVQKRGSPVVSGVGASPTAAGVRIASYGVAHDANEIGKRRVGKEGRSR